MATKIIFETVRPLEVVSGAFTVQARATDGRWFYHEGPKGFAYFTEAQAERLARRVRIAGKIDTQFWLDGSERRYGTVEHEYALLEAEYFER